MEKKCVPTQRLWEALKHDSWAHGSRVQFRLAAEQQVIFNHAALALRYVYAAGILFPGVMWDELKSGKLCVCGRCMNDRPICHSAPHSGVCCAFVHPQPSPNLLSLRLPHKVYWKSCWEGHRSCKHFSPGPLRISLKVTMRSLCLRPPGDSICCAADNVGLYPLSCLRKGKETSSPHLCSGKSSKIAAEWKCPRVDTVKAAIGERLLDSFLPFQGLAPILPLRLPTSLL